MTDLPRSRPAEPRWPATLGILVGILLLLALPDRLIVGPRWLIPAIEVIVVIALLVRQPDRLARETRPLRFISIALIALLTLANATSLFVLVGRLLHSIDEGETFTGTPLIFSAIAIWATNVIAFALWFWELDGGGPNARRDPSIPGRDFLFPQMTDDGRPYGPPDWSPSFLDYLYVAFTNGTAFSPTDTLPLTGWAKVLMGTQSALALVTVAVVAARAVNILA